MPRRPTWDDVPRWTDGRFAKRTRFSEVVEKQPGLLRTVLVITGVLLLNLFATASVAALLDLSTEAGAILVMVATFLAYPLGYVLFRKRPWWLLGYMLMTVGLIVLVGSQK
jgi:hypothetical protein